MNEWEKQKRKEDKADAKRVAERTGVWREAMKNPFTRKVIWDILEMTNLNMDKFTGKSDYTHVLLGRESVGLQILTRLEAVDKTSYPRLIMEMNDA